MKKYDIKKNFIKKALEISVKGMFNKEESLSFINDYKSAVNLIPNKNEYTLSIDCKELLVASAEIAPDLKQCFEMYHQDGFKVVECVLDKSNRTSTVVKMQLSRLAREAGLDLKLVER